MSARRAAQSLGLGLAFVSGAACADETLKVCLNEDASPYSSRHNGAGVGFDLAVADALARRLGRTLEITWFESKLDENSSSALEANALLSDGRCQLVAGYTLNEDALGKPGVATARLPDFEGAKPADRRRLIALGTLQASKPYHYAALTMVLGGDPGKPIAGLGDLDGLKIGVEGGTLSDTKLAKHI